MKYIYLLFTVFIFSACSKEEGYGPFNLKDGQEVELLVSHRYGAINDPLTLLPQNQVGNMELYYFAEREAGYNYRIKARMVVPETPPQDGAAYHLDFLEVISKEKYEGDEPFEIALIQSPVPAGPMITIVKKEDHYWFGFGSDIQLTYHDEEIGSQLEEIWKNRKEIQQNAEEGIATYPGWKSITATVTHDPENFGKAYLVSHIELKE